MNRHQLKTVVAAAAMSFGILGAATATHAASVDAVLKVGQNKAVSAQKSQARIDKLSDQTRDLWVDYKTVNKQIDGLRVYNKRLEKQIADQNNRIGSLDGSISEVTVIQRQITPLVIRMIDSLAQFVELDVPVYKEEREERIEFLRTNVDRSDLSVAEKFRQVLEAYKIENEYARNIATYKGTAPVDGVDRDVNFLAIGRIALLFQTTDTEVTGAWDKKTGQWVQLDKGQYRNAVQKGLRIARKQASIDVLKVPVSAPEVAK